MREKLSNPILKIDVIGGSQIFRAQIQIERQSLQLDVRGIAGIFHVAGTPPATRRIYHSLITSGFAPATLLIASRAHAAICDLQLLSNHVNSCLKF